ncbi:MAG TPA: hypothetical protein VET65_03980 [Candidatus Limnocylindrales bacterium]|nr:hypothetical protein [Candidatus Limnocylindrales bacterium]
MAVERAIPGSQPAAALLGVWAGFPVHVLPRPIVLAGSAIVDPPGFSTGQAKVDYLLGAIAAPSRFPTGPSTLDGYPLIDAGSALTLLTTRHSAVAGSTPPPIGLTVTDVHLDHATFTTDRGDRSLPAWLFSLSGADGPAAVLAVAPSARWSPPGSASAATRAGFVTGAILSPDGRTLTTTFAGAPAGTGPCDAGYRMVPAESSAAVVITVLETYVDSPGVACPAIAQLRTISAVLASPLGARVAVDAVSGQAIAVTGAA